MELISYFESLKPADQQAYAERCGTTANYLSIHIMCTPPRKMARPPLMHSLADESRGKVSFDEVLKHFYPRPDKKRATS